MATSNPLARFLTGTPQSDPLDDIQPGDTSRMAVQAFIFKNSGSTPVMISVGALRLHGAGVSGSMAALADVGQIADALAKTDFGGRCRTRRIPDPPGATSVWDY